MRSVVIGTAGHIDHGKTTLLHALTGIDADRLPEERSRGMTIDVGFAHLDLDDGTSLDFVDVPGHDRLVGNMLVGAGEVDAVLLVVAADDGPRAQTLEHLELLDALGHDVAVVAITKVDAVEPARVAEVSAEVRRLVDATTLRSAPIVAVSGVTGDGLAMLREALIAARDRVLARDSGRAHGPVRLSIDRAFSVKGRGDVVTGTLRGGSLAAGSILRLVPGGAEARVREVQVRHGRADRADGGRTGLNVVLAGSAGASASLRRGVVLTAGVGVEASDRWLVALTRPVDAGTVARLHVGTDQATAVLRPLAPPARPLAPLAPRARPLGPLARPLVAPARPLAGRHPSPPPGFAEPTAALPAVLRLSGAVAALPGDRGVIRDPATSLVLAGVTLLDPDPPRGPSRRRATPDRLAAVAGAIGRPELESALLDLKGALTPSRRAAIRAAVDGPGIADGTLRLADDVTAALEAVVLERVSAAEGAPVGEIRAELATALRRLVTVDRSMAPLVARALDQLIDGLAREGRIARSGDRLVTPAARSSADDALEAAMDRLEASLDLDVPPGLASAATDAGCPAEGIRRLESAGRIVRVEDDLAWSRARYDTLRERAIRMASAAPLTPAAWRDAIGGNRRVALALLEDLGRKGVLRRTDAGHVPGPRATVHA